MRVVPLDETEGHVALGLALRHLGNTGIFMHTTAHPDDENNGLLVMLNRGQGIPDGARDRDPRQRRTERDRPGDLRGARRAADRGAGGAAPLRRRRTVLHARGRLRLLVQPRRDVREVGTRRDHRRLRPADPHDPPGRHRHAAADRQRRRTAPHGVGGDHARRLQARRPTRRSIPEQIKEGLRPWQPKKLITSPASASPASRRRRARSRASTPASTIRCSARPTPKSAPRRAACTSARAWAQLLSLPAPAAPPRYQLVETTMPARLQQDEASLFDGVDTQHREPGEVRRRASAARI